VVQLSSKDNNVQCVPISVTIILSILYTKTNLRGIAHKLAFRVEKVNPSRRVSQKRKTEYRVSTFEKMCKILSMYGFAYLHDNSKSVLEGREVGHVDRSGSGQSNLGGNIPDQRSRDKTGSDILGLNGSEGGLVGTTNTEDITHLISRVRSLRGKRNVAVDLVEKSDVDLRELARTGETGKDGSVGVASTNIQAGEARLSRKSVGGISSSLNSRRKTNAGTGAELGHLSNIEDTSRVEVSVGVINAKVSSLVGLEGKLDIRGDLQRSLQDASSVGSALSLVNIELGVGELGSNLRGKSTALTSFGLDGH
jgi:hypothetical protein